MIDLKKLHEKGVKELAQIKSTVPYIKQQNKIHTKKDELTATISYAYEMPALLMWNQVELKLDLEDKCKRFNIQGDMEIDDGNSFSYAVVVQFPVLFHQQVIKTQFAPYEAMPQLVNPAELGR